MIALEKIIMHLKPIKTIGNTGATVTQVASFDAANTNPELISWVNEKNIEKAYQAKAGVIMCPDVVDESRLPAGCTFMLFKFPRKAFRELLLAFFVKKRPAPVVSKTAVLGNNVKLGKGVFIGHNTIIEDDVEIGDNVYIYHNNSILSGTVIKDNVQIGSNNTIGGVGFGYEKDEQGHYQAIPHIGGVLIEENAEIGNNTCIDRAVMGYTILKKNCKVDNLVHIAHGVVVGENSLVIAHAMIGGSTIIGDNVWVAPNAALINKITIGDNATIGLGAVVVKNVKDNETVIGNPAKPMIKMI